LKFVIRYDIQYYRVLYSPAGGWYMVFVISVEAVNFNESE